MEWVELVTRTLATAVEAGAAIIVAIATVQALFSVVQLILKSEGARATEEIRLNFGRWLALALEFMLAGDILRTTIAPTWNEIGQLAAIVVLRTVLNYFLQLEIDRADLQKVKAQT